MHRIEDWRVLETGFYGVDFSIFFSDLGGVGIWICILVRAGSSVEHQITMPSSLAAEHVLNNDVDISCRNSCMPNAVFQTRLKVISLGPSYVTSR